MTNQRSRSPLALGLALLAPLSAAACGGGMDAPPEAHSDVAYDTAPTISGSDYATLVAGNTAFATDLYQAVSTDPTKNLFMSPTSISTALAMTYAGANNATATQMADVLHFGLPAATVHAGMDRLALDIQSRGQHATSGKLPFALHEMDAVWANKDYPIEAPFLDTLSSDYDAGVYQLDFAGDPTGSTNTINGWVANQTDGKIQNLLAQGQIDANTRLVLTNAIYFEAAWATPFDPNETSTDAFTTAAGATVQVPTMHAEGSYPYAEGSDFQALELGYDGGDIAMDVLLPTATDAASLTAFEQSLTTDRLTSILGSLAPDAAVLSFPKVNFAAPLSLKDTLVALGMTNAFDPSSADFSLITTLEQLYIAFVQHKGFIDIDENGTTAAAATAVGISGGAAPIGHDFTCNHPYVIIIRDLPTGSILFIGRVSDPSQTGS